jgi:hypothetical protein
MHIQIYICNRKCLRNLVIYCLEFDQYFSLVNLHHDSLLYADLRPMLMFPCLNSLFETLLDTSCRVLISDPCYFLLAIECRPYQLICDGARNISKILF